MARKRNIVEAAMRNSGLVFFFMAVIVIFGFFALPRLKKNEFPDVTIRTGVVAVVYPGATADEIEQRVAGVTEQYLFTFSDVNKNKTYSYSKDGMLIIIVNLNNDCVDAKMTWSRIRQGLVLFKSTSLPKGVIATAVIDDFGNASSLLLAIESDQRSSRELREFADKLADKLRTIETMGNIKIVGEQKEEIAVYMDPARMTQYAISPSMVTAELAAHSLRTISGKVDNLDGNAMIHVEVPIDDMYQLSELVVFSDPITGQTVKLRDVARIERRYQEASQYILYSDSLVNNNHCLMFSMEMRPGYNVVAFGEEVNKKIDAFLATAPPDIKVHRITDQPVVVNKSVMSFLKDLIEAILIVILVMLMLFPLRTALVSSTSVPVCIAAAWAIMYLLGMELNTVTLAALIVVLGMIVDDSVVVIDGYTDMLNEGHSRWYSAAVSTKSLMTSMLIATCSISCMFFPMLPLMNGTNMGDFIKLFPWAIFITLACSFLYAIWVIPYMSSRMIAPSNPNKRSRFEKIQAKFFDILQNGYKKLLNLCFRHKWATVFTAIVSVLVGVFLFTKINIQMLPKAERDSFAVEIHLAYGSSIEETAAVADSLTKILKADKRVKSVTEFIGMASPRFHMTYAPEPTPTNAYAQFIVITKSENATKEMMNEYPQKYENMFPIAQIRFKQMDYQIVNAPVEYYIMGDDYEKLGVVNDSIKSFMKQSPNLFYVHSDFDETEEVIQVELEMEEATRLGVTQSVLSVYLAGALSGSQIVSLWEGSYNLHTTVYTEGVHDIDYEGLGDMLIPTSKPGEWVPLRQVAKLVPQFKHCNLPHRNGMKCITVAADVVPGAGQLNEFAKIDDYIETLSIPEDVILEKGGSMAVTMETMPSLIQSIVAAIVVMFIVLIIHYAKIGISILSLSVSVLCIFGATFGLWLFGLDMSVTAILGVISLIGIIVRNAIIMYDYAAELRLKEHLTVHQAAYEAGMRRMRPIFLTSATTALGVIPMILAKTLLWEPMGVVICFGTIITFPLVVTVLPVAYCLAFDAGERDKKFFESINKVFLKNLDRRDKRNEKRNKLEESILEN
ncbi:MAG: efflux RND transporter permease subunit [Bacteroidales bacterium]|nr:efflux RND transporter permease subunit [Bacteroidales bacterium]